MVVYSHAVAVHQPCNAEWLSALNVGMNFPWNEDKSKHALRRIISCLTEFSINILPSAIKHYALFKNKEFRAYQFRVKIDRQRTQSHFLMRTCIFQEHIKACRDNVDGESSVKSKTSKRSSDSLGNTQRISSDNSISNHSSLDGILRCPLQHGLRC